MAVALYWRLGKGGKGQGDYPGLVATVLKRDKSPMLRRLNGSLHLLLLA